MLLLSAVKREEMQEEAERGAQEGKKEVGGTERSERKSFQHGDAGREERGLGV